MKTLEQLGVSPAPWHIEKNTGVLCAKSERYKHPIVDDYGNFENNNDKRLIAAAPELYAALFEMVEMYRDGGSYDYEQEVIKMAKAALAKAAGESEVK